MLSNTLSAVLVQCAPLLVVMQQHAKHQFTGTGEYLFMFLSYFGLVFVFTIVGSNSHTGVKSVACSSVSRKKSDAAVNPVTLLWRNILCITHRLSVFETELASFRMRVQKLRKACHVRHDNVELAVADLHSRLDLMATERMVLARRISEWDATSARKDAAAAEFSDYILAEALKASVEGKKDLERQVDIFASHISDLQESSVRKDSEVDALKQSMTTNEQVTNQLQSEVIALKQSSADNKELGRCLQSTIDSLDHSSARHGQQLEQAMLKIEEVTDALTQSAAKNEELQRRLQSSTDTLKQTTAHHDQQLAQLQVDVVTLKQSVAQHEMTIQRLQPEVLTSKQRTAHTEELAEQICDFFEAEFSAVQKSVMLNAKGSEARLRAEVNSMQHSIVCSDKDIEGLQDLLQAGMSQKLTCGHDAEELKRLQATVDALEASLAEQKADCREWHSDVHLQMSQVKKDGTALEDDLRRGLADKRSEISAIRSQFLSMYGLINRIDHRLGKLEAASIEPSTGSARKDDCQTGKHARFSKVLALAAATGASSGNDSGEETPRPPRLSKRSDPSLVADSTRTVSREGKKHEANQLYTKVPTDSKFAVYAKSRLSTSALALKSAEMGGEDSKKASRKVEAPWRSSLPGLRYGTGGKVERNISNADLCDDDSEKASRKVEAPHRSSSSGLQYGNVANGESKLYTALSVSSSLDSVCSAQDELDLEDEFRKRGIVNEPLLSVDLTMLMDFEGPMPKYTRTKDHPVVKNDTPRHALDRRAMARN